MDVTIIWTVLVITLLGVILAAVLFLVARKFRVEEDPRIDEIEKIMPGANCGGCGFAGCRAFADACVKAGNLEHNFCPVGGNETMKKVAEVLGCAAVEQAPKVAVVRCDGSCGHRPKTNDYDGLASCRVKASLYAGDTGCAYGCLGCGDCVGVCDSDAIHMNPATGLPEVDEAKCIACGQCVKVCPHNIIELRNVGTTPKNRRRVYVSCVNQDKGGVARKACTAACIGCGKCAKVCKFDAITIVNNLCYIDFEKCKACGQCVFECPTGAIKAVNFVPKKVEPKPAAPAATVTVKVTENAAQAAPKSETVKPETKEV